MKAPSGKCRIKTVSKPAPKPASKPAPKPAPKPASKPVSKPTSKPAPKSYNEFQNKILQFEISQTSQKLLELSKTGKEFDKDFERNKIKGFDLIEHDDNPSKLKIRY